MKNQYQLTNTCQSDSRCQDWSSTLQLNSRFKTDTTNEAERRTFSRKYGLFVHHLKQWRKDFEMGHSTRDKDSQVRDLKVTKKPEV